MIDRPNHQIELGRWHLVTLTWIDHRVSQSLELFRRSYPQLMACVSQTAVQGIVMGIQQALGDIAFDKFHDMNRTAFIIPSEDEVVDMFRRAAEEVIHGILAENNRKGEANRKGKGKQEVSGQPETSSDPFNHSYTPPGNVPGHY